MHSGASVAGSRDLDQADAAYTQANIRQSNSISLGRSSYTQARQRAASLSHPDSGATQTFPSEQTAITTPRQRKRLSINFSLPVVGSSSSLGAQNVTAAGSVTTGAPRRTRPSHSHSASVSLPPLPNSLFTGFPNGVSARQPVATSPNSNPSPPANRHKQSASVSHIPSDFSPSTSSTTSNTSINNSIPSSNKASAIEYYFSQLAYRERRVVELRDEIKRMELQLRQAEDDLSEFRKQVPSELMPMGGASTPRSGLSRSNTYSNSTAITPPSAVGAARGGLVPYSLDSVAALPDEPKRPALLSSASSPSDRSNHSNSLSDSSQSSADVREELKLRGGLPLPPSRQHPVSAHPLYQQQQSGAQGPDSNPEDVLHKGRRVAEEIGNQFWSFLDDMKGAPPAGADPHPLGIVPTAAASDSGLPNLALLQQQHQTQQLTGRSAPMAPPRKPRRTLAQGTEPAAPVAPPVTAPVLGAPPSRRVSASMRGPMLGGHTDKSRSVSGDGSNSYYLV